MAAVDDTLTEEQIHLAAKRWAEEAALFWQNYTDQEEFVLEETSKTIKNIQIEDSPEYDPLYERLSPVYTEDEDTVYKTWEKIPFTAEMKAERIRGRRNKLLLLTDNSALTDRTASSEILNYRQALRDVTEQETFPHSIIWPIKPIG